MSAQYATYAAAVQLLLQRQPLPVDVLNNWWDIYGTVADWFAALGTVGALLWAVIVYRGQLEDKRREQATQVTFGRLRHYPPGSIFEDSTLMVENRSNLPVYNAAVWIASEAAFFPPNVCQNLDSGERFDVPLKVSITSASVSFRDAAGYYWERELYGNVERTTRTRAKWRHRRRINLRLSWRSWWKQPGM